MKFMAADLHVHVLLMGMVDIVQWAALVDLYYKLYNPNWLYMLLDELP